MSAPTLPAAPPQTSLPPASVPHDRTLALSLSVLAVAAWILSLAILTWYTANPPVINRVQLRSADLILVGRWVDQAAGRFDVEQELKRRELQGVVTVRGVPKTRASVAAKWVIPVTRRRDEYKVTEGVFFNPPQNQNEDEAEPGQAAAQRAEVAPACYPASDDVLRQIEDVLNGE